MRLFWRPQFWRLLYRPIFNWNSIFWNVRSEKWMAGLVILLVLGGASLGILKLVEKSFEPAIGLYAQARAKQRVVEIINTAIKEEISSKAEYKDLMYIHKDNNGRPVMVQPNVLKIDKLQSEAALIINKHLMELEESDFGIPLGQITGNKLLAALGPFVRIHIVPVGTVETKLVSSFDEAGVNQTRHRLALRTTGEIQVIVPYAQQKTKVVTDVLIADNILIGPVPKTILNFNASKLK